MSLRVRTPRLELRLPTDDELTLFAAVAEGGVHPPEEMPFYVPWTDGIGEPGFRDAFAAYHRAARGGPGLELGVWAEGEPAGVQALRPRGDAVETGSWLGRRFQRRGYGTEMRVAAIELAFALGAEAVTSGAFEHNAASARVSEKLGYRPDGEAVVEPRGEPVRERRFRLARAGWRPPDDVPVEIDGLDAARRVFGVDTLA